MKVGYGWLFLVLAAGFVLGRVTAKPPEPECVFEMREIPIERNGRREAYITMGKLCNGEFIEAVGVEK